MNLALKENNLDINVRDFDGKVAAIFSYEDEVAPAKVLGNFRKDKDQVFSWAVFWKASCSPRVMSKLCLSYRASMSCMPRWSVL